MAESQFSSFLSQYTLEQHKEQVESIKSKFPTRLPIIVDGGKELALSKFKYLVPSEISVGELISTIKRRIQLSKNEALFMFVRNVIPSPTMSVGHLYDQYKDETGYLFVKIRKEATFG